MNFHGSGKKLKRLRISNFLSVGEVASFLNTDEREIEYYEDGSAFPTKDELEKLSILYGVEYPLLCEYLEGDRKKDESVYAYHSNYQNLSFHVCEYSNVNKGDGFRHKLSALKTARIKSLYDGFIMGICLFALIMSLIIVYLLSRYYPEGIKNTIGSERIFAVFVHFDISLLPFAGILFLFCTSSFALYFLISRNLIKNPVRKSLAALCAIVILLGITAGIQTPSPLIRSASPTRPYSFSIEVTYPTTNLNGTGVSLSAESVALRKTDALPVTVYVYASEFYTKNIEDIAPVKELAIRNIFDGSVNINFELGETEFFAMKIVYPTAFGYSEFIIPPTPY